MITEEETPLKFCSSPGMLISIASSKVAQLCWYQHLNRLYPDEIDSLNSNSFKHLVFSCIVQFQVPSQIRALIDHDIILMAEELERWWLSHERFFDNGYEILSKHLHYFVLDSSGNISPNATAKNILNYGKLNPVDEFRICCAYCLENDIERLWPSVSEDYRFKDVDFLKNPTLYYWICRMKNELSKVPRGEEQSAEFSVISSSDFNAWEEIEFLWDRLNKTEQLSLVERLMMKVRPLLMKVLLPKLKKSQLDRALQKTVLLRNIFYSLAHHTTNNDHVSKVWNYVKNQIETYHFAIILYDLFDLAFLQTKCHSDHAADLMYDVWSTAPDHLRAYIFRGRHRCFFEDLLEPDDYSDKRWYGRDVRFHLEILSNSKALSIHRTLWLENWRKVMLIATPTDFEKFLKIWADNEEEIETFKASMMDYSASSKYFDKFIETGLSDELIDYLKFCSSNEETVRNVMKEIIVSNLNQMQKFERFDTVVNFYNFIDKAFSSPDLAEKFKREKIHDCLENWCDLLRGAYLDEVKNIFECFLSSDADLLVEVKRKCIEQCKLILSTGSFTDFQMREWKEFLTWCDPSGKEIAAFKETFPIDHVFSVLLRRIIDSDLVSLIHSSVSNFHPVILELIYANEYYRAEVIANFSAVEGFLRWYFESAEAIKIFKLNKIHNYKEIDNLRFMLKNERSWIVDIILNWFFVGNDEERKKFEEVLAMEDEDDDDWETVEEEEMDNDLESEVCEDEEMDD